MKAYWPIPQTTLLWLIFTHALAVIYFYSVVPLWLYGLSLIAIGWRLAVYLGSATAPPRYLLVLMSVAAGLLLALLSGGYNAVQLLIQLMLVGYGLKFLELKQRRDTYVLVLLGYFVVAVGLVIHQGMNTAAWLLLVLVFNSCALLTLQRPAMKKVQAVREVGKLLATSLPLTLVLFLLMPRVSQLWQMPRINDAATGLSDSMAPGDIASLGRDPSLAFRVTFDTSAPPREQLYWRALVLDFFDGRRWSRDPLGQPETGQIGSVEVPDVGQAISYEVIAEPSYQRWLFGLQVPDSKEAHVVNTPDQRLIASQPLTSRFLYRVDSYPQVASTLALSDTARRRNLLLPQASPRTRALIRRLQQQHPEPMALVTAILMRFNQQPYHYTLRPPPLVGDMVDQFIFESRAGFCSHYASAFTVMMRFAGIPARIVTGYQGGEWDSDKRYLSVYQYDAHAWVEIWLADRGWIRIDPTAMVAPERVEMGLAAALSDEQSFLEQSPFSLAKYRDYWLLNQLRLTMANLDYAWSRWLLGYNVAQQKKLLTLLLGEIKQWKISLMLGISFLAVALWLLLTSGLQFSARQPASQRLYLAACRKLAKAGCARKAWEGPVDYAVRVNRELPEKAECFGQLSELYVALRYQPAAVPTRSQLTRMKNLLARL